MGGDTLTKICEKCQNSIEVCVCNKVEEVAQGSLFIAPAPDEQPKSGQEAHLEKTKARLNQIAEQRKEAEDELRRYRESSALKLNEMLKLRHAADDLRGSTGLSRGERERLQLFDSQVEELRRKKLIDDKSGNDIEDALERLQREEGELFQMTDIRRKQQT